MNGATRSPRPIRSKSSSCAQAELRDDRCHRFGGDLAQRKRELFERLVQQALAEFDGFAALQVLQILPYRRASLRSHDEIDPGRVRRRALGCDDLHRLAVA
jgi:hypothetical protein